MTTDTRPNPTERRAPSPADSQPGQIPTTGDTPMRALTPTTTLTRQRAGNHADSTSPDHHHSERTPPMPTPESPEQRAADPAVTTATPTERRAPSPADNQPDQTPTTGDTPMRALTATTNPNRQRAGARADSTSPDNHHSERTPPMVTPTRPPHAANRVRRR